MKITWFASILTLGWWPWCWAALVHLLHSKKVKDRSFFIFWQNQGKALKIFFACIVYSMEWIHHHTRPKMRQAIIQVSTQNVEYCSVIFPCDSMCHVWIFWRVWTIFCVFYLFFSFDQVQLSPNMEKYCLAGI